MVVHNSWLAFVIITKDNIVAAIVEFIRAIVAELSFKLVVTAAAEELLVVILRFAQQQVIIAKPTTMELEPAEYFKHSGSNQSRHLKNAFTWFLKLVLFVYEVVNCQSFRIPCWSLEGFLGVAVIEAAKIVVIVVAIGIVEPVVGGILEEH